MPLYMDIHLLEGSSVSISDLIHLHNADLAVQRKYGVQFIKFWVNHEQGMTFCLMEAPDEAACIAVHREAHGYIGCNIVEVSEDQCTLMMAQNGQNEHDMALDETGHLDNVYRMVLMLDIAPVIQPLDSLHRWVTETIYQFKGRTTEHAGHERMAVFNASDHAVHCAQFLQQYLLATPHPTDFSIAVCAGTPLTPQEPVFFGYAKQLAKYLCRIGTKHQILVNSLLARLYQSHVSAGSANTAARLRVITATQEKLPQQTNFSLDELAQQIGMSRAQFYRKIKQLAHCSPNQLLRRLQLREAMHKIHAGEDTIAAIAYETGFNNPSYFSKIFQQHFGVHPSHIRHQ